MIRALKTNHYVYIGLGSNLKQPCHQIQQALKALATLPQTQLLTHSPYYQSAPLGFSEQPDYINGVAQLSTTLSPLALLEWLQYLELNQGRVRTAHRWGPRTLDLDLLLYGTQTIKSKRLTLPHPGLYQRAFVLYPLYDCAPELILPDGQLLAEVIQHIPTTGLKRINCS